MLFRSYNMHWIVFISWTSKKCISFLSQLLRAYDWFCVCVVFHTLKITWIYNIKHSTYTGVTPFIFSSFVMWENILGHFEKVFWVFRSDLVPHRDFASKSSSGKKGISIIFLDHKDILKYINTCICGHLCNFIRVPQDLDIFPQISVEKFLSQASIEFIELGINVRLDFVWNFRSSRSQGIALDNFQKAAISHS